MSLRTEVQSEFNKAILRRDKTCQVGTGACSGQLSCSHFYGVGSTPNLRYHPDNCVAQCFAHHRAFEDGLDEAYNEYIDETQGHLYSMKNRISKLTDGDLREIKKLCKQDDLEAVKKIVEKSFC